MKRLLKRIAVLSLVVCLAFSAALADITGVNYTQLEKLQASFLRSGFKGQILFSLSETAPCGLNQETWTAIRSFLSTTNVNYSYTPNEESEKGTEHLLSLKQGGNELTQIAFATDESGKFYIRIPLLCDQWLGADQSFDWSAFIADGTSGDGWPGVLHLLYAIQNASDSWKNKALSLYDAYQLQITGWMQQYVSVQTQQTGSEFTTIMSYEIPSAAILGEIKQLLVNLMSDSSLLSLLREILSPAESAAYLQPGMLLTFLQMADKISLDGSVVITRKFDKTGTEISNEIHLPFAKENRLQSVDIQLLPASGGWSVAVELQPLENQTSGYYFQLSGQTDEDHITTGSVTLRVPDAADDFSVAPDDHPGYTEYKGTYNFYYEEPVNTDDTLSDKYSRKYEAGLLFRPDSSWGLEEQSIAFTGEVYSNSSSIRSPTYIKASLTWSDLGSGSTSVMQFNGKTLVAWDCTLLPEAKESALRVDLLDSDEKAALCATLMDSLTGLLEPSSAKEQPAAQTASPSPSPLPTIDPSDPGDG